MRFEQLAEFLQRRHSLAKAHPRSERTHAAVSRRQYMRLQGGDDLQFVLDVAQEQVRVGEFMRALRRQVTERLELLDCRHSLLDSKPRIAAAVNQRERLHDEFKLADSTAAELDIAIDHRR